MNCLLNPENVSGDIYKRYHHFNIRLLKKRDSQLIIEHLLRLDKEDAYLRFNMYISLCSIEIYFSKINWDEHVFIGFFDNENQLRGVSQLSITRDMNIASLGISVEKNFQNQGIGFSLLITSVSYAKDIGFSDITIEYATKNYKILSWVKRAGFSIKRRGSEMKSIFSTSSINK